MVDTNGEYQYHWPLSNGALLQPTLKWTTSTSGLRERDAKLQSYASKPSVMYTKQVNLFYFVHINWRTLAKVLSVQSVSRILKLTMWDENNEYIDLDKRGRVVHKQSVVSVCMIMYHHHIVSVWVHCCKCITSFIHIFSTLWFYAWLGVCVLLFVVGYCHVGIVTVREW